ncbi:lysosome-associated membrane glycoprotein 2-like isoform X2 [Myxocyprinus asiaticus]|uniref:lysosome-associated membrane glycoprotein 2-like isoform X2 n=1 Tax=Myxocyprinus asiaticus TaxID=70543 RepID=UPI002222874B|nr:lysosome-associated membrane glycoprotein 2-like isoform X2 [Myxocyprinus asiaticus]
MALRGCLTLFLILLSGIVYAQKTTVLLSTSVITPVTEINTTSSPTHSTHASTTTATITTIHTNVTTGAPTTSSHNTTNSTTDAPTTTIHNTTNSTTEAPTTEHTNATTAPTTTPTPTTPPVLNPTVGNYSVRHFANSSACLLAKMGLQFSFKTSVNASLQTINLDPNVTTASGTCGSGDNNSSLMLKSEKITVQFVFTNVSQKFHLHALMLSIDLGNEGIFNESNTNLSLWEASVGSSYMCKKEQSYKISDKLTINTFELQVQPFAVQKDTFSTAEECFLDSDLSFLVPIAVGVALSFLIILVLISYLIGRKKSHTGYQSV